MFSVEALRQFFSVQALLAVNTGVFILFVIRLWNGSPAMFAQWIAYRRAKAEEKASHWTRLSDENKRLDARCYKLEDRVTEREEAERQCQERLTACEQQLAIKTGYQIGRNQAAGDVTILESTKRLEGNGGEA